MGNFILLGSLVSPSTITGTTPKAVIDGWPFVGENVIRDMMVGDVVYIMQDGLLSRLTEIPDRSFMLRLGSVDLLEVALPEAEFTPFSIVWRIRCQQAGMQGKLFCSAVAVFNNNSLPFRNDVGTTVNTVGVMDIFDVYASSSTSDGIIVTDGLDILFR